MNISEVIHIYNYRTKGKEELKTDTTDELTALKRLADWARQSCYHYGSAYRQDMIDVYEEMLKKALEGEKNEIQS